MYFWRLQIVLVSQAVVWDIIFKIKNGVRVCHAYPQLGDYGVDDTNFGLNFTFAPTPETTTINEEIKATLSPQFAIEYAKLFIHPSQINATVKRQVQHVYGSYDDKAKEDMVYQFILDYLNNTNLKDYRTTVQYVAAYGLGRSGLLTTTPSTTPFILDTISKSSRKRLNNTEPNANPQSPEEYKLMEKKITTEGKLGRENWSRLRKERNDVFGLRPRTSTKSTLQHSQAAVRTGGYSIDMNMGTQYDYNDGITWGPLNKSPPTWAASVAETETSRTVTETNATTLPVHVYEERVRAEMVSNKYTYFKITNIKLCELLATKDDTDISELWKAAETVIADQMIPEGKFQPFGYITENALQRFIRNVSSRSFEVQKEMAQDSLYKINQSLLNEDIAFILSRLQSLHNINEGEELIKTLNLVFDFKYADKQDKLKAIKIINTLINAYLKPVYRLAGHPKLLTVVHQIQSAISKREQVDSFRRKHNKKINYVATGTYKTTAFGRRAFRDMKYGRGIVKKIERIGKDILKRFKQKDKTYKIVATKHESKDVSLNVERLILDRLKSRQRFEIIRNGDIGEQDRGENKMVVANVERNNIRYKILNNTSKGQTKSQYFTVTNSISTKLINRDKIGRYLEIYSINQSMLSKYLKDDIKDTTNIDTTKKYKKRYHIISATAKKSVTPSEKLTKDNANIYRSKFKSKYLLRSNPNAKHGDKNDTKFKEVFFRRNIEITRNDLSKINKESGYSDVEDELKFKLSDALRHGALINVQTNNRRNFDVQKKRTITDVTSESDNEGVIKNNIYKFFAMRTSRTNKN